MSASRREHAPELAIYLFKRMSSDFKGFGTLFVGVFGFTGFCDLFCIAGLGALDLEEVVFLVLFGLLALLLFLFLFPLSMRIFLLRTVCTESFGCKDTDFYWFYERYVSAIDYVYDMTYISPD